MIRQRGPSLTEVREGVRTGALLRDVRGVVERLRAAGFFDDLAELKRQLQVAAELIQPPASPATEDQR